MISGIAGSNQPFERSFTAVEAESRIEEILAFLGFKAEILKACPNVEHVALYDSENRPISCGSGKGRYCHIGARAEALEHFVLDIQNAESGDYRFCAALASQYNAENDGILKTLALYKDCALSCRKLRHYSNHGESLFIPSVLLYPSHTGLSNHASDGFLGRYTTNSGIAFGCTVEEALLHALNEVIERYCLSLCYLALLHKGVGLDFLELPYKAGAAECNIGNAKLLLAETPFNTAFAIAIAPENPDMPMRLTGSGSSVCAREAICRAVTELQQVCNLADEEEIAADIKARAFLERIKFDALIDIELRGEKLSEPEITDSLALSAAEQISLIISSLKKTGFAVYWHQLADFCGLGYVVQIYIPGMDRFHLIRSGQFVVPDAVLLENVAL